MDRGDVAIVGQIEVIKEEAKEGSFGPYTRTSVKVKAADGTESWMSVNKSAEKLGMEKGLVGTFIVTAKPKPDGSGHWLNIKDFISSANSAAAHVPKVDPAKIQTPVDDPMELPDPDDAINRDFGHVAPPAPRSAGSDDKGAVIARSVSLKAICARCTVDELYKNFGVDTAALSRQDAWRTLLDRAAAYCENGAWM